MPFRLFSLRGHPSSAQPAVKRASRHKPRRKNNAGPQGLRRWITLFGVAGRVRVGLAEPVGERIWPDGPKFPEPALKRPVVLYGAGHVGQAILRALTPLSFQIMLVDARATTPDTATADVVTPLPEAIAEEAGPDTFHVVLTTLFVKSSY